MNERLSDEDLAYLRYHYGDPQDYDPDDDLVRRAVREIEVLRARVAQIEATESDGWTSLSPDGLEWHDSRETAEAYLIGWYTEHLHDTGEAHPDLGYILRVMSHTIEVVEATADDDSEAGERCRDLRADYLVGGYKLKPGSGTVHRDGGSDD